MCLACCAEQAAAGLAAQSRQRPCVMHPLKNFLLRNGFTVLQSLDYKNTERKEFWDALMVVAEAEMKEAKKQDEVDRARLRGMREPDQDAREDRSVQAAVDMDVQIFLTGEARLTSLPDQQGQAVDPACLKKVHCDELSTQLTPPLPAQSERSHICSLHCIVRLLHLHVCTAAWCDITLG